MAALRAEVTGMADTYDLHVIQGEPLRRLFRRRINGELQSFQGLSWGAQIRKREPHSSGLILDLTPHLRLTNDTSLLLDVPGLVTLDLNVRGEAHWDLFIWPTNVPDSGTRLLQGLVIVDPATTDIREAQ